MTDDFVAPLRAAISRADPSWVSQPSHLRRRLDEELGQHAREHRAQVHQLIVAAEERIPVRLQRHGWSPGERADLVAGLVSTRGWTAQASEWAVVTWAAALDLTTERPQPPSARPPRDRSAVPAAAPPIPPWPTNVTDLPDESEDRGPEATLIPLDESVRPERDAALLPQATVLPDDDSTDSAVDSGIDATGAADVAPQPSRSSPAPSAGRPGVPTRELPTRGMKVPTKRVAALLGEDVHVAYPVMAGPSPAWLLLALPVGLASFAVPALAGVFLLGFMLIIIVGRALWPKRLVAVAGDRVWLIRAKGYNSKPREVIAETSRDAVEFAGGVPPSVRIDGERLWFLFPITSVARKISSPRSTP